MLTSHFKLRDYQIDCVKVAKERLSTHDDCLIVMATGSGKSAVMSKLISKLSGKILVIVNQNKLVTQGLKNLELFNSDIGIYNAGMGKKDLEKRITIASIQSIWKQQCHFDYIVVDEVHRFDFKHGMFGKFIKHLCDFKCIGFTATPFNNKNYIYGEYEFFKEIAFEKSLREMTETKFLVPLKLSNGKKATLTDIRGVKLVAGDYNQKQLEERAVDKIDIQVKDALAKRIGKTVWMCVSINHAQEIQKRVPNSIVVHSKNNQSIDPFTDGNVQDIISVMMLGEGVDMPMAQTLVLMRPTRSLRLYVQAAGRILRPYENKNFALLLDYGHVVESLGSIYDAKLYSKNDLKLCINCETFNKSDAKTCYSCGDVFMKHCPKCFTMYEDTCPNCTITIQKRSNDYTKNLSDISHSNLKEVHSIQTAIHAKNGIEMLRVDYMKSPFEKLASEYFDERNPGRSYYYRDWIENCTYIEDKIDIYDIEPSMIMVPKTIELVKNGRFTNIEGKNY